MNNFKTRDVGAVLRKNSFPGQGIVVGLSKNGKHAVMAYFILGKNEDSRNRVFNDFDDRVMVYPFDASRIGDPSKVIYTPMRKLGRRILVASSRHGEEIAEALENGGCYEDAFNKVSFAEDALFTPRIGALLDTTDGYCYKLSIAQSSDADGNGCDHATYSYAPTAGVGHIITALNGDAAFSGNPQRVTVLNSIDAFANKIWENLDAETRTSLYVRYISLASGRVSVRVINRNQK